MAGLLKNVSSQNVTFCLVNATTGAGLTGATVTVSITKDNGTQGSGAGTTTEKGNGQYNYAPTQGETNAADVGFLFTATNAVPVNLDFHTDAVDGNGNPVIAITSNRKKGATATFEFLMQNSSTGAPKTGLTVASTISKDGGAPASTSNSVTEIGLGQYQLVLTSTEMTANNIFLQFTATGAVTANLSIQTQP